MNVKITRTDKTVELPKYHTSESAAFDFAASQDTVIPPRTLAKVPTGLIIEAPEGHFLLITARSSLATKKGLILSNGVGTIDRDYSGPEDEIKISVYNFTDHEVRVEKGERLAQGLFLRVEQADWNEVEKIRDQSRGGYGTTGGYK
ncbi:MAG: dUTP diphosphatase [Candidatus Doudnabacteria bacterium]|nr:dUTP diphosphatase [Candidatus Doudnabacteria bacterium]